MGLGSKPKKVDPPAPPVIRDTEPAQSNARDRLAQQQAAAAGRQGTILTSQTGTTTVPQVTGGKSLLGQ